MFKNLKIPSLTKNKKELVKILFEKNKLLETDVGHESNLSSETSLKSNQGIDKLVLTISYDDIEFSIHNISIHKVVVEYANENMLNFTFSTNDSHYTKFNKKIKFIHNNSYYINDFNKNGNILLWVFLNRKIHPIVNLYAPCVLEDIISTLFDCQEQVFLVDVDNGKILNDCTFDTSVDSDGYFDACFEAENNKNLCDDYNLPYNSKKSNYINCCFIF